MRAVGGPGRWVWGLSGLATAAVLLVPGVRLLTAAGAPWHRQPAPNTVVRSLTVPEHVTSLDVQSYGGLVKVAAGPVSRAEIIETISYVKQDGGLPEVVQSVSAGHLTLADPACATSDCTVGFAVTMPGRHSRQRDDRRRRCGRVRYGGGRCGFRWRRRDRRSR